MRYTSDATMDDRALRDVERWKDKIELRLDNRQVFFLFFTSALVACFLFIVGVLVGKHLESRGKAVTPEIEDPLALLDKVASAAKTGPEVPPAAIPKVLFPSAAVPRAAAPAAPKPPAAKAPAAPAAKPAPEPQHMAAPAPKPAAAKVEAPAAKPLVAAPPPKKLALAPVPAPVPGEPKGKGRFTLQLGSFPDKAEAEAFSKRFAAQSSYVVASDIPGKGTWYRVRVGDYGSAKDAIQAKSNFEKQHSVIAYVVGPTH